LDERREIIKKIAKELGTSQVLIQEGKLKWKLYDEEGNLLAEDIEALDRVAGIWCVCSIKNRKAKCEIMEEEESIKEVEVDLG